MSSKRENLRELLNMSHSILGKKICIVEISPTRPPMPTFGEYIKALLDIYSRLGYEVEYCFNRFDQKATNIIIGWHRFFMMSNLKESPIKLPPIAIIFNLEQLSYHRNWHKYYLASIKNEIIIDYSNINHQILSQFSNRVYYFKFGYYPIFDMPIQKENKFLFFGKVNERRKMLIQFFANKGLTIQVIENDFGHFRDINIRNSRAVLNVARENHGILEAYRLWHSLSCGTSVFSERGMDLELANQWSKYVSFFDINDSLTTDNPNPVLIDPNEYKKSTSLIEEIKSLMAIL